MNRATERTKWALIAAATEMLAERGCAGATARAIADHASTNQALVFYHFGSVNGLLIAALEAVSDRRMESFGRLIDEADSASALLLALEQVVLEDTKGSDVAVLTAMLDAARGDAELAGAVKAVLKPWQVLTERAMQRLVGQHALGAFVPVPAAARLVMATVLGLELLGSASDNAGSDVRALLRPLHAILGTPTSETPQGGTT